MAVVLLIASGSVIALGLFMALGLPVLRGKTATAADERGPVLQSRLAAIERDRTAGLIGDAEAAEAVVEAQRAALSEPAEMPLVRSRNLRFMAISFLALTPIAAALLYLRVGAPTSLNPVAPPAAPTAETVAALPDDDRRAMIESMVGGLSARLEQTPGDPEGWRMLAKSELVLQRAVDSAASYRRLFALDPGTLEDWRNFASALIAADPSGKFPADAEFVHALGEIEKRSPKDPMALFYQGGAARETGDAAKAVELWSMLLAAMPADAPVRATLEQLIDEAKGEANSQLAVPQ